MPRYLDTIPETFRFTKLATENDLGLHGAVKEAYAEYYMENVEAGVIKIGDQELAVSEKCLAMLKAVLKAGCCLIEERAVACRKVFDTCVVCPTPEEFLTALRELAEGDVWITEIRKAVEEEWT